MILIFLDPIWDLLIKICFVINNSINSIDFFTNSHLAYADVLRSMIDGWQNLLSGVGYFPALVLSVIDSFSQFTFFIVFVLASLILVLIKVCSPLLIIWDLKENNFRNMNFSYLNLFIKLSFLMILFPIIIKINYFIANSINIGGIRYLNVIYSISIFLLITLIFIKSLSKKHLKLNE